MTHDRIFADQSQGASERSERERAPEVVRTGPTGRAVATGRAVESEASLYDIIFVDQSQGASERSERERAPEVVRTGPTGRAVELYAIQIC